MEVFEHIRHDLEQLIIRRCLVNLRPIDTAHETPVYSFETELGVAPVKGLPEVFKGLLRPIGI